MFEYLYTIFKISLLFVYCDEYTKYLHGPFQDLYQDLYMNL